LICIEGISQNYRTNTAYLYLSIYIVKIPNLIDWFFTTFNSISMNYNKLIFTLCFSILGLSSYGQYGTTSAGDHINSAPDYSLSYTIGEVINVQTTNSAYSNKIGVIQPIKRLTSFVSSSSKLNFTIYPNPTSDFINVISEYQDDIDYIIYDVQGKIILKGILSDRIIELGELTEGNYFLQLKKDDDSLTKKFQKINN